MLYRFSAKWIGGNTSIDGLVRQNAFSRVELELADQAMTSMTE